MSHATIDGSPLFVVKDATLMPMPIAASSWGPDVLHGGPVAALVARAAEEALPSSALREQAFFASRLTIDLFRAVPRSPLTTDVELIRQGRRVIVARVSVLADGLEVTRGQVLFLRRTEGPSTKPIPAPTDPNGLETEYGLDRGAPLEWLTSANNPSSTKFTGGYHHLVKSRWPTIPGRELGSSVWVDVQYPIVENEVPTPFQRLASVSDFGNALANYAADWSELDQRMDTSYINTDINVHLLRPPEGRWLGLVADRSTLTEGVGLVEVSHFDRLGHYGHSSQARLANSQ